MGIELLGGSVKFGVDFFPLLSSFVGDSASLCSFGGSGTSFVAYLRLTTTSYLLSCVTPPPSVGMIRVSHMPSRVFGVLATSFFWQISVTCKAATHDGASWSLVGLLPLEVSSSSAGKAWVAFCPVLAIREGSQQLCC